MCFGCEGSSSTILRRREICTSIERSNTSYSRPRASSISLSRDIGSRGCCTSTLSTENSPVVSGTDFPSRIRVRVERLSVNFPNSNTSAVALGARGGGAPPLFPAGHGGGGGGVEREFPELEHLGGGARCARPPGRRAPPQHGVDAREQLSRVERLGQVVVGPHFEPHDAVD